jgi:hypothetical protein
MRGILVSIAITMTALVGGSGAYAATAEQEQAFIDAYKTAFDAKDATALNALLFSEGAIPMAVDFYQQMMQADFGKEIASITLEELSADELVEVDAVMPTPDGGSARLVPKPYKKLVIKIDTSDANGTSSSTSSAFVAEQDGRLGIAMPVAAD